MYFRSFTACEPERSAWDYLHWDYVFLISAKDSAGLLIYDSMEAHLLSRSGAKA
jgi:hypothetical protein